MQPTEAKIVTAKQIDDWAKLLFDALSRIALLSALAVLANGYDQLWLKLVVGASALCLAYWIVGTLLARFAEFAKLTGPHAATMSLRQRIKVLVIAIPVFAVTLLASWGSVEAVIRISKVQYDKQFASPISSTLTPPVTDKRIKSN